MSVLRHFFPRPGTLIRFLDRSDYTDSHPLETSLVATRMDIFLDNTRVPEWFWPGTGYKLIPSDLFMVIDYTDRVRAPHLDDFRLDFDVILMRMNDGKIAKHPIRRRTANIMSYILVRFPVIDIALFVVVVTVFSPIWWTIQALSFVKNKILNR